MLLLEKHSTSTEKQELVFLNTVLPEKKHEGCSNNSKRARRGSNNGPAKPLPHGIAQLTEAAQARPRGGQKRHDLGTTWP